MCLPWSARWLLLVFVSIALARPQDNLTTNNTPQQDSNWLAVESSGVTRHSKEFHVVDNRNDRETLLGEYTASLSATLDQRTPPKLKEQQRKSTQKEDKEKKKVEEGHKGIAVPVPPEQIEETLKKHETRTSSTATPLTTKKHTTSSAGASTTTKDGISTWIYLSGSESTTVRSKRKTTTTPPTTTTTTPMVQSVEVTTAATAATTSTEPESRVNQKNSSASHTEKKKNKRRRRPTTSTGSTSTSTSTSTSNVLATKPQSKPTQKPLSTQIYNYLAREVMPSVGVGLLGLVVTAGLAGLFMYPFGGGIARRTYEVDNHDTLLPYEDNKHDGHREDEVFGQVLAGMSNNPIYSTTTTTNNNNNNNNNDVQYKDTNTATYHDFYYPVRDKYRSTTFRYPISTSTTSTKYLNVDEISITEASATEQPPRHRYSPTRRPIYQQPDNTQQQQQQQQLEITTKDSYLPENYDIRRYSNEMRSFLTPRKLNRKRRAIGNGANELDTIFEKVITTTTLPTTSNNNKNEIITTDADTTISSTITEISPITTTFPEYDVNEITTTTTDSTISTFTPAISKTLSPLSSSSSTTTTTTSSTIKSPFLTTFQEKEKIKYPNNNSEQQFTLFSLFRRFASYKLRLGLDMLKSTSRAFYRYLDDVERRIDRRNDKNKPR